VIFDGPNPVALQNPWINGTNATPFDQGELFCAYFLSESCSRRLSARRLMEVEGNPSDADVAFTILQLVSGLVEYYYSLTLLGFI
jgi:hypothetical protein